jgi:ABC-2 type transport system permease protein
MYTVVTRGAAAVPRFADRWVGNALFIFVPLVLVGLSWAVFEDREQFQMLKYVYACPAGLLSYLLGRSAIKIVMAIVSSVVVLVFGVLVLDVHLTITPLSALGLLACLAVGLVGIVSVGLVLTGCSLVFARQSMTINEGSAAVLLLFCGAVFPADLLPHGMREIAFALPVTYWIEGCRRALIGPGFSPMLARFSAIELGAIQVAVTALWFAGGLWVYRTLEAKAQREGKLDQTTAW